MDMSSVASVVIRSRAGRGIPVELITLPCKIWSLVKPECNMQYVMALKALTSSTVVELAARRFRVALCKPLTIVVH